MTESKNSKIKIRMIKTVCPYQDFGILGRIIAAQEKCENAALIAGQTYDASANAHGAVCGITEEGISIGVRPGEFEFVETPE